MGINRSAHFKVDTLERWHGIGDSLVPKAFWEDFLELPGTRTLTLWAVRPDKWAGRIQVTVEPSTQVELGIYLAHNDHYDLADVESQPSNREAVASPVGEVAPRADRIPIALDILRDDFQASIARSDELIRRIAEVGVDL
jgi:hypothetical protein